MPGEDAFENAEERRLFYVALTRAKSTVTLITLAHKESAFVAELVKEHQISVWTLDGNKTTQRFARLVKKAFWFGVAASTAHF